jgi:hypothetical protein
MHMQDEDKKYYQNQRGKECCKVCPRNTIIVGSIEAAAPDTVRKCVCKPGTFTQYVDFNAVPKYKLWDPGWERWVGPYHYPLPMAGYPCEPCHAPQYFLTFTPEKKGMYCAEPTINGVVMEINKEEEGCTSEWNPVCVKDFESMCRVWCPGG